MAVKKYYSFLTLFLIGILGINLLQVRVARADEGTPTEPPAATEVVTEPAAQASVVPVESQSVSQEATVVPAIQPSEEVSAPATTGGEDPSADATSIQGLENTEIVILDEEGQALVLGSQDAVKAIGNSDPVWCPESVTTPTPGANGCTVSYASITDILAAMQAYPESFSENGTIFLEQTSGAGFTTPLVLDDSDESLGPSFNSLNVFNLTIQGGWDPATGSTSGQTAFSGSNAYIQVGSLTNPWLGSLAINNISVTGASQDAIQIFASNVALTNVSATESGGNGISITANDPGTVALNNVNASHNGQLEGSEHVGSGVYIAGASTLLEIVGGTFIDNTRYGIEAMNSITTSLQQANLWTDQDDYAPGSVVTISGNSNRLNGNNTGFLFGETIDVVVQGPNGYTATCEATANSFGGWSCQITLWRDQRAVGGYTYTAVGLSSGISVTGTFTDARTVNSVTVNGASTVTVGPGGMITLAVSVTTDGNGANARWRSTSWRIGNSGVFTCVNHTNHDAAGAYSETFTITAPVATGTYSITIFAYQDDTCNNGGSSQTFNNVVTVAAATNTPTNTSVPPTSTSTNTPTNTAVPPTNTSTNTPTSTTVPPTSTATSTPTNTGAPPTNTATNTPTATQMAGSTATNTPTPSSTVTTSQTATPTATNSSSTASTSTSQSARPRPSPTTPSAFVIPLTGGELIELDCNSIFWAFGIKLTFFNLCDQQTSIHSVGETELPLKLPTGYTFVRGLKVDVLTNGQLLKELPGTSGIEMDFPLNKQARNQFAVLYWSDPDGDGKGRWIELTEQMNASKISELLGISTGEELYQLIHNAATGFYPILTTEQTGIFILVKK